MEKAMKATLKDLERFETTIYKDMERLETSLKGDISRMEEVLSSKIDSKSSADRLWLAGVIGGFFLANGILMKFM